MVSDVCKKATVVREPSDIYILIDEAFLISNSGRRGPVWLDVPIDVQATLMPSNAEEKVNYPGFHCAAEEILTTPQASDDEISLIAESLLTRNRPTLYAGSSLRIDTIYQEFLEFINQWPVAVVTAWNSNDLLWDEHPCYSGRPGSVGNRAGNFAAQYSECLVILGCRLNLRLVSYNWQSFGKHAWKCHVDIDKNELEKPTLNTDLKVQSDLHGFFPRLAKRMNELVIQQPELGVRALSHWKEWREFNRLNLIKYCPVDSALPVKNACVNPYRLIHRISKRLPTSSTVVCADGTACVVGFQASIIKEHQRWFHNSGCASMGYELPAAIGAYYATGKPVTCIAGDGSIMMNLQELAYIGGNNLPIKIILLNNKGYHSIRQTQRNYFPDNPVGCGSESGLPFPNFSQLAVGFAIKHILLNNEGDMELALDNLYYDTAPSMLEVLLDLDQDFSPKLASKKMPDGSMVTAELEDMTPLLGDHELEALKRSAFSIC